MSDRSRHDGEVVELTISRPAAGGSCLAFTPEATYFVRGAIPGERVRATVIGTARAGKVRFATTTEVLAESPWRVEPPCPLAGQCGGCDLQHVDYSWQARWKADVVIDQLRRIGRFDQIGGQPLVDAVRIEQVGSDNGLNWRTRYVVETDQQGMLGFHRYRSSEVIAVPHCPVVVSELQDIFTLPQHHPQRVQVALGDEPTVAAEEPVVCPPGWLQRDWHWREALDRRWRVATQGFWQAHRDAPDVLASAVREYAGVAATDEVADLYAGVGLFAAALADARQVTAVEGDRHAVRLARRNLHDLPHIRIVETDVRRYRPEKPVAVTVLDPPRAGAGDKVLATVAANTTRAVVHVGCDGASTARDLRTLATLGWEVSDMRWFDLFPMTHHVESVALLEPIGVPSGDD